MLNRCSIFALFFFLLPFAITANANKPTDEVKRVIYLTLDGVRWQDFYLNKNHFPKFWQHHARQAVFYGDPLGRTVMETASVPISLPSYQSQMTGEVQPCKNNHCGRVHEETLPETLIRKLSLSKNEVATFSSWPEISSAIEHIPGVTYSNTGNRPVRDPISLTPDKIMNEINQLQKADHPIFKGERYDKYTFTQAWHYWKKHKPRFLWISLNDADEAAHLGDKHAYGSALSYYDNVLDTLLTSIKKDTMIIVTTDHGRGNGKSWTEHAVKYPESKKIWCFVVNGQLQPDKKMGKSNHYSTLSIRPSIEHALGVF